MLRSISPAAAATKRSKLVLPPGPLNAVGKLSGRLTLTDPTSSRMVGPAHRSDTDTDRRYDLSSPLPTCGIILYITEITLNHHPAQVNRLSQALSGIRGHQGCPKDSGQDRWVPLNVRNHEPFWNQTVTAIDGHYELAGSLSTFRIPTTLQDSLIS